MKVLVCGDPHGKLDYVNQYAQNTGANLCLITGDLSFYYKKDPSHRPKTHPETGNFYQYLSDQKTFDIPVIIIKGNHENFKLIQKIENQEIVVPNLMYLPNGEYMKFEHNNELIMIGGLGGNFSPLWFESKKPHGGKRKHFTKYEVERLKTVRPSTGCDILLLHDVIGGNCQKRIEFNEKTYQLFEAVRPKFVFLGHYHWWGHAFLPYPGTHIVILPKIEDGYFLLDTKEWKGEGFDVKHIGGNE